MICSFFVFGHPNILGTHKTTLEFTKSDHLTLNGDCIVGVSSDYDPDVLSRIAQEGKKAMITIEIDSLKDMIHATLSPKFNDSHEIVIRKTDFASARTFAVGSDKAACDIDRRIVKKLALEGSKAKITISTVG